jgi:hypothetical protein
MSENFCPKLRLMKSTAGLQAPRPPRTSEDSCKRSENVLTNIVNFRTNVINFRTNIIKFWTNITYKPARQTRANLEKLQMEFKNTLLNKNALTVNIVQ